jgi:hypothetical protein
MTMDSQDAGPDESTFGLDQVLNALGRDLKRAQNRAAQDVGFGLFVRQVEVELAFTVGRAKGKRGGINLKVLGVGFEAGANGDSTSETVHRIQLALAPGADTSPAKPPATPGKKQMGFGSLPAGGMVADTKDSHT